MLAFVVVAMTVAAASEVSLRVEPSTPCVERGRLASALQAKGLRVREGPAADRLNVHVSPAAGAVEVRGTQGERSLERRVPVSGAACPAVERVVVALIDSWANMPRPAATAGAQLRLERDAGVDAANSERAAGPAGASVTPGAVGGSRADPGETALEREDERVAPSTRADAGVTVASAAERGNVRPAPAPRADAGPQAVSPSGEREDVRATLALRDDPGTKAVPPPAGEREDARATPALRDDPDTRALSPAGDNEDVRATPALRDDPGTKALSPEAEREDVRATPAPPDGGGAPSTSASLRLDVAVLGGATIDTRGLPAGTGSLLVRGALGRWGLLLDASLESARSATRAPVTVTSTQQALSLSFSVAFEPTPTLSLDVALGLRGWRVEATSTGVDEAFVDSTLRWGGVLSAGLAWRLTGPLFLTARGSGSVRDQVIHVDVAPIGTVLSLNPWIFGLQGGVLVRFD